MCTEHHQAAQHAELNNSVHIFTPLIANVVVYCQRSRQNTPDNQAQHVEVNPDLCSLGNRFLSECVFDSDFIFNHGDDGPRCEHEREDLVVDLFSVRY